MGQTPARSARSLQDKINHLFSVVRPAGQGREYTLPEVHRALAELGHQTSTSYLSSLRTGQRDNPSKAVLEGLAQFFGVSPLYFFDDEQAAAIEQELELLSALSDADIRAIALRATQLNDTDRELLRRIAETMGQPGERTTDQSVVQAKDKDHPAPGSGKAAGGGSAPAPVPGPPPASPRRRSAAKAAINRSAGGKSRP